MTTTARSPPKTASLMDEAAGVPRATQSQVQHYDSEPNLCSLADMTLNNITIRNTTKRMRRESNNSPQKLENGEFMAAISAQDFKLEAIMSFMRDVRTDMSEMRKSMEFMSNKYDELLNKHQIIENEHKEDRKLIKSLESKVDYVERCGKAATIEIKNIPPKKDESKDHLFDIIMKTAAAVKVTLGKNDVKNIYRVNTNNPSNKPVIVELLCNWKKDEIIQAVKSYNKKFKNDKLNTSHLLLDVPKAPVYVSESLTFKNRKLYAMARSFARENNYLYHWTTQGSVYIRKADGHPVIRIMDVYNFDNLLK